LGLRLFFERTVASSAPIEIPTQDLWTIYRQAVITNVLNPKVALFFLSFLPQFVDPTTRFRVVAFLFLGAVFIFNGTIYCAFLAWFAAAISTRLRNSSGISLVRRATGALFVGLGLKLAVSK
jgi:threonine/homoserine/homoserine lactone efflux protein